MKFMYKGEILHKKLSYKIQGIFMEIRRVYGPGLKEKVYCNLIEEYLIYKKIFYKREAEIKIHSHITGKVIGIYRPDFIIDNKIIAEIKAVDKIPANFIDQMYSYLKVSKMELGIFVNFKSTKLYIKRIILTNDCKFLYITK